MKLFLPDIFTELALCTVVIGINFGCLELEIRFSNFTRTYHFFHLSLNFPLTRPRTFLTISNLPCYIYRSCHICKSVSSFGSSFAILFLFLHNFQFMFPFLTIPSCILFSLELLAHFIHICRILLSFAVLHWYLAHNYFSLHTSTKSSGCLLQLQCWFVLTIAVISHSWNHSASLKLMKWSRLSRNTRFFVNIYHLCTNLFAALRSFFPQYISHHRFTTIQDLRILAYLRQSASENRLEWKKTDQMAPLPILGRK